MLDYCCFITVEGPEVPLPLFSDYVKNEVTYI